MRTLSNHADLICINGKIYTVDPVQPWAEAVAIRKHRILAVGNNTEIRALAGPSTEVIDLGNRLMLPGLCDAHIHFCDWSLSLNEVQLADCTSKAEMLSRIAARAAETDPGQWITGQGWNEGRWGEIDFPSAADLDRVTGPDRPALFRRSDMHGAVVNSAAMRIADITQESTIAGGVIERDGDGVATGIFKELAIGLITEHIPKPSGPALEKTLLQGMARLHAHGITAIHDQRIKDEDEGPRMLAAYQQLAHRRRLQLRVNCNVAAHDLDHLQALGLRGGFGDDYLRLGHVKFFVDGSLGSRTAWMLQPFTKLDPTLAGNVGLAVTPIDEMARDFRRTRALGFPISVHAIGDRANRTVLDLFEELQARHPSTSAVPDRIEHVQIINPVDLPRLAALGITASVQPLHATDDMDTADLLVGERGAHMYNFRSLRDSGAKLALGSDAPVADVNPFHGIHAALYRRRVGRPASDPWYPDECIRLVDAIHGYTLGAAEAGGRRQTIGSITPGKRADMIVLDRDLFELAKIDSSHDEIAGTQVAMTLFDGKVVYSHGNIP